MSTQVNVLICMQKIDDQISAVEVEKVRKPKQLDDLRNSVKNAEMFLAQVQKKIDDAQLVQKTKESEIKTNNELKQKYGHQLDGIKNNKEYKALNSQIALLDEKNKNLETEILNIMEEIEEHKEKLAEGHRLKKKADENLAANEKLIEAEIVKLDEQIKLLKEARMGYAKQLPITLTQKYTQLIVHKNRKAVSYILNHACSGCGFHMRPQVIIELNSPDKINYCESCGRILVKSMD
jgi:predicted  nucleic acid-binding Zn-ribbon protein